jgi:hypothetical protein
LTPLRPAETASNRIIGSVNALVAPFHQEVRRDTNSNVKFKAMIAATGEAANA